MPATLTAPPTPLCSCRSQEGPAGSTAAAAGPAPRAGGRPAEHPSPSGRSPGHPAGCYSPWRRRRRRQCWRDRRDRSRRGCWGAGSSWAAAAAARRAAHPRCRSRGCSPEPSWCRYRRGARTWGCGAAGGRLEKPSAAHRAGVTLPRRRAKGAARRGAAPPRDGHPAVLRGGGVCVWQGGCPSAKSVEPGVNSREESEKKRKPNSAVEGFQRRVPAAAGRRRAGVPRAVPVLPLGASPAGGTAGSGATWPSAVPVVPETF